MTNWAESIISLQVLLDKTAKIASIANHRAGIPGLRRDSSDHEHK